MDRAGGCPGEGNRPVDGRRARGDRRRAEIIEATLAVVTRDGAAGVTHRSVAQQAGITTSLSTYYFATLDDLLVAALCSVADEYTSRIRRLVDGPVQDRLRGLAELIVESGGPGRQRALAERELSTMAARRPALGPVARHWREGVVELASTLTDDPQAVAALVAVADGLCTAVLIDDVPADTGYVLGVLARAMGTPHPDRHP
ncbi:TetR/AcrR family transcriptional regulator [Isoptericola halotolerans]|uniref:DNA-binding transcriptional regulator YbjK n=1 Tax=Isoptericola halotolerans TaxID=300560 RepID=A0ABX2A507_9MICO|nr:TetR family transcriptional regulator [Isoptericola halotolerans]NOV96676.1 DNA-binding transcriptional regulator YbjK [Isoptericola halotolerans]